MIAVKETPRTEMAPPPGEAPEVSPGRGGRAEVIDMPVKAPEFTPFGQQAFWAMQADLLRQGAVAPCRVEGPLLAEAYAEVARAWWLDSLARGRIDRDQALLVIVLGAGAGRFPRCLPDPLAELLDQSGLAGMKLQFLICDDSRERLAALGSHPLVAPLLDQGLFKLALWGPAQEVPRDPADNQKIDLAGLTTNPPAVLANDVFSRSRQDWFLVRYGESLGIEAAMVRRPGRKESAAGEAGGPGPAETVVKGPFENLELRLRPGGPDLEAHSDVSRRLLAHYNQRLDHSLVCLPTGAVDLIALLEALFPGGAMILASDRGYHRESELRNLPLPAFTGPGAFRLPVNHHALARHVGESAGGAVSIRARGRIFSVLLLGGGIDQAPFTYNTFRDSLAGFNPADMGRLRQTPALAGPNPDEGAMRSWLRLSRFDPEVLAQFLPELLKRRVELPPEDRMDWIETLERVWNNYLPWAGESDLCFDLGLLAMDLGAWGLADRCFRWVLHLFGDHPAALYNLALCGHQTGRGEEPRALLEQALAQDPGAADIPGLLADVRAGQDRIKQLGWYRDDLARNGEILLMPIGGRHAAAWFYQYRDPNISVMTRLPEFESVEATAAWIEERRGREDYCLCAAVHRYHGFIGVVSLRRFEKTGYFYFWMGADFQGFGFGRRAAVLLLDMLKETRGLETAYTTVYKDNVRSIVALDAVGFGPLRFKAGPPDEDLLFYSRHPDLNPRAEADVFKELKALLAAVESPIQALAEGFKSK